MRALLGAAGFLVVLALVPGVVLARPEAPHASRLQGRWAQTHTCQQLVTALRKAGLAATAPAAVGDYFPGSTPQQLAKKTNFCRGAKPQLHSHFFTGGSFGSVDQHNQQVDNGTYRIVNANTVDINSGTFHFHVSGGNRLTLIPVITTRMRRAALAHPLKFSTAVWEVAVAYAGQTWKRVPCGSWC